VEEEEAPSPKLSSQISCSWDSLANESFRLWKRLGATQKPPPVCCLAIDFVHIYTYSFFSDRILHTRVSSSTTRDSLIDSYFSNRVFISGKVPKSKGNKGDFFSKSTSVFKLTHTRIKTKQKL